MKKLIYILIVLIVVVTVSGCSNTPQATYTGNGFTFNYPANWNDTTISPQAPFGANYTQLYNRTEDFLVMVANFGTGDYQSFIVLQKNDAKAATSFLGSLYFEGDNPQAWASNQKALLLNSTTIPQEFISEKQTTVDGIPAYQITFKDSMTNIFRTYVYFTRGNAGYCLIYEKRNTDDQATLENILKSFKFQ